MARAAKYLNAAKVYLAEHGETQMVELANALKVTPATLVSGTKAAILRGEIVKRSEGRAVFYSLGEGVPVPEEPADDAPKFNAALWADGELILWNVELNTDGRSLTLTPPQVRMLSRLLNGNP